MGKRLERYAESISGLGTADLQAEFSRQNEVGPFAGGILGRKRGILDREVARRREAQAQSIFDLGDQVAAEGDGLAVSPEDRAINDNFRRMANYARLSGNTELVGQMIEKGNAWLSSMRDNRIKAAADEASNAQKYGAENWGRFTTLYDDLYRESSDFISKRDAYNSLISAYSGEGEPGNASDIAAINSLQRMIDPGVSVREGDVSLLQNLAGIPDWLITAANRVAKGGGRFTPEERRSITEVARGLMAAANAQQADVNVRFQRIGEAGQIAPELYQKLRIPVTDIGGETPLNFGKPIVGADASGLDLLTQPDSPDAPAIPLGQAIRSIWDPAMRKQPGESDADYRQRLAAEREPEPDAPRVIRDPGYTSRGTKRGVYVPPSLRGAIP